MCFFKKKKKEPINSRYLVGDPVRFRNSRDELINGYVYSITKGKDDVIYYEVQVGGECPYFVKGIPEDKIISNIRH